MGHNIAEFHVDQPVIEDILARLTRGEAEVVRRVRSGERVSPFDTVRKRKDGTPIDGALTVSPVRDREGRIVRRRSRTISLNENGQRRAIASWLI